MLSNVPRADIAFCGSRLPDDPQSILRSVDAQPIESTLDEIPRNRLPRTMISFLIVDAIWLGRAAQSIYLDWLG